MDLIYTSGNNRAYARMTQEAGWLIGVRSDETPYNLPIQFVDINYREPDWDRHLLMVERFRPRYATVPDLSETKVLQQDIDRALRQIDQISPYCDIPLVVPKLASQLALLPGHIAIGLSVVSRYGGIQSMEMEMFPLLSGRRIHLLGGSPHKQMEVYRYLSCYTTIMSADGNMFQYMSGRGKYWHRGKWIRHPYASQMPRNPRVVPECLLWSLHNIREAWERIINLPIGKTYD